MSWQTSKGGTVQTERPIVGPPMDDKDAISRIRFSVTNELLQTPEQFVLLQAWKMMEHQMQKV